MASPRMLRRNVSTSSPQADSEIIELDNLAEQLKSAFLRVFRQGVQYEGIFHIELFVVEITLDDTLEFPLHVGYIVISIIFLLGRDIVEYIRFAVEHEQLVLVRLI